MKYKLIVSDYDDTLFSKEIGVTQENLNSIKKFQQAGGIFTIATGRALPSLKIIAEKIKLSNYLISYNGASLYDMEKDEEVVRFEFQTEQACKIIDKMYEMGFEVQVYFDDKIFAQNVTANTIQYEEASKMSIEITNENLSDFTRKVGGKPMKILAFTPENAVYEAIDEFQSEFPFGNFMCSKPTFLECVPQGASKGEMILKLAKILGVERSEIIAVGDSLNDISMIEVAGMGIAMGNAHELVKNSANFVTKSVLESGVSHMIETLCFNDKE